MEVGRWRWLECGREKYDEEQGMEEEKLKIKVRFLQRKYMERYNTIQTRILL